MKYMGSKSRIKKDIVPVIQEYINKNNITKYLEPFVGGANIIDSIVCNEKVGNDKSEFLIEMFKAFTEDNSLIDDKRLSELTKEEYALDRKVCPLCGGDIVVLDEDLDYIGNTSGKVYGCKRMTCPYTMN